MNYFCPNCGWYYTHCNCEVVNKYFEALNEGRCPTHKCIVQFKQVGHCVYGDCGCRLYQGTIPGKLKVTEDD